MQLMYISKAPVGAGNEGTREVQSIDWPDVYRRLVVYFQSSFSLRESDAADATQAVIERLLKTESQRDNTKPFLPWCYRIAKNYGIDLYRRKVREPRLVPLVDEGQIGTSSFDPETQFEKGEIAGAVSCFIENLEPGDREIAYLRFFESLAYQDIATIVGRTNGTVRYRAYIIRKRLRNYLEEMDLYG